MTLKEEMEGLKKRVEKLERIIGPKDVNVKKVVNILDEMRKILEDELTLNLAILKREINSLIEIPKKSKT